MSLISIAHPVIKGREGFITIVYQQMEMAHVYELNFYNIPTVLHLFITLAHKRVYILGINSKG